MNARIQWTFIGLVVIAIAVYVSIFRPSAHSVLTPEPAESAEAGKSPSESRPVIFHQTPSLITGMSTNRVVRLKAGMVLAKVNGKNITLADLFPIQPGDTNAEQILSPEAYQYLLNRAINRELIFQTAKAQGVELSLGQQLQLDRFRQERQQAAPGDLKRLNSGVGQFDFEVRDTTAMMLQNTLLENLGASANVTPDQVQLYYLQHSHQYDPLPADEPARSQAWALIDRSIREQLAASVRADYQTTANAYIDQLKAKNEVVVNSQISAEER